MQRNSYNRGKNLLSKIGIWHSESQLLQNNWIYFYEKINASAVFHNDHTAFRVDWMPFGGLKHSGEAVGGIDYTFSDLMYDKLIVINSEKITT